MLRKIIEIDSDKCNGCGLCVTACHEGAIGLRDGKAVLLRDDYCDGLGDCLPVCPTDAIHFVERDTLAYNEAEVKRNMEAKKTQGQTPLPDKLPCGCPGTNAKTIARKEAPAAGCAVPTTVSAPSQLNQWPVQIKLVPVNAPYFDNAHLLVSADCAAYAHGGFHNDFMQNKVTLIGCPKLDAGDYSEKLTDILRTNNIRSVTVVRMEVPCCGGLENAVKTALQNCGKMIPWQVTTIATDGSVLP